MGTPENLPRRSASTAVAQKTPEHSPKKPSESAHSAIDYGVHMQQVREQLRKFGVGPVADLLTPEGLDNRYIRFARQQLLGTETPTPENLTHVGEVDLTGNLDIIRRKAHKLLGVFLPYNMGYGHLRPAMNQQKLMEVLGADTELGFIGGPDILFNNFIDRRLQAFTRMYIPTSLEKAHREGMIDELPEHVDSDRKATRQVKTAIAIAALLQGKRPTQYRESLYSAEDVGTASSISAEFLFTGKVAGPLLRWLLNTYQRKHPGKEMLILNTFPTIAGTISHLPKRTRDQFFAANFFPDVAFGLRGHVPRMPNYIEAEETQARWEYRLNEKRPPWIRQRIPNTVTLDGYITPLAVFKRHELAIARKEALARGEPLTIIATASGIAQTQQGAFEKMIRDTSSLMKRGEVRMVIQCGAAEGKGNLLYQHLKKTVDDLGLQNEVILHVAETPKAALDFVEAISWAPIPLAFYVKGSEMSRISPALDIPHIPTGAVGKHELWNIAASLARYPDMVAFPPGVGEQFIANVKAHFPKDGRFMGEKLQAYIDAVITNAKTRSASTTKELFDMVRQRIARGIDTAGESPLARQDTMLVILADMMRRKEQHDASLTKPNHSSSRQTSTNQSAST